jgi:hypothetical protein
VRRSASRPDLHPLAALALALTGLAALVGGLIVVSIGIAEWWQPQSPFPRFAFEYEPRPYDLLPLATIPCLIGAAGLLLPGGRLTGGTGGLAVFAVSIGVAMLATPDRWPVPGELGILIVSIGLATFGRWVTLSGRYPELGPVPRLLGIAPIVIVLWMLALDLAVDFDPFLPSTQQCRLFASVFIGTGMNWVVIWWLSWFGRPACPTPACPVQAREVAPQPASQVIRTAMRQVMRRQARPVPLWNASSAPRA